MSHENDHLPVLRVLGAAHKNVVVYYPLIAHALGEDVGAALFVSNFLFWEGKQQDAEGWIYKTQPEITKETGMKRSMQETARKKLRELDILEDEVRGVPGKLYYRFHWERLNALLSDYIKAQEQAEKGRRRLEREENAGTPIIHAMAALFDDKYFAQNDVEFAWGSKSERGKQFGNIKRLHDLLAERLGSRKARQYERDHPGQAAPDGQFQASYEEIMTAWEAFLTTLPEFYRTKRFSPDLLASDFSKIINEVLQAKADGKDKKVRTERTRIGDTL